ncbi:DUF4388 domain-containing protein [Thermosynechococcus sichuanensis E542]|uniref:DUF4388 domain-containing protein n=1 Tax=Thermosynechococcus sichuanensis E542 TaxID=2016101 RepID=A0A7D6EST8_9CYAN|nr:DUF4388 domain-containing protein [Thermosynechococcus vestitus]QLL29522.1 DUF4388 domain-containing protein [Thermosynechococcus vestitus E542]
MKITGYLSEFSLGEIFRFLEQGQKTGCLSIKPLESETPLMRSCQNCYIFFRFGQIVAATRELDHQGLQQLIEERGFIHIATIQRLLKLYPLNQPLGLLLKSQGALDSQQLQLLFKQQVLTPIPELFSLTEGWFKFDANHPLPLEEMTGLSAPPRDVALVGLRLLRDWTPLMDKLPLPDSTMISLSEGQPPCHLSSVEWQVWEYVDKTVTLEGISQALNLPILEVQKICFRLMVAGLVEEIINVSMEPPPDSPPATPASSEEISKSVSDSFLRGVLAFLKIKAEPRV